MSDSEDQANAITSKGVDSMLGAFVGEEDEGAQEEAKSTSNLNRKDLAAQRRAEKIAKEKGGKKGKKGKKVAELEMEVEECSGDVCEEKTAEASPEEEPADIGFVPHLDMPVVIEPCVFIRCGVCKGPPEYCSFMNKWDECKKWIEENAPQYLPESVDKKHQVKKKAATTTQSGPKGIIVQRMKKGSKTITKVDGLQSYEILLSQAARLFRKKFAAASTIQKDAADVSYIEIQGDVTQQFMNYDIFGELFPSAGIDPKLVNFASAGKIRVPKK